MTLDTDAKAPGSLRGDDREYPGYRRVGIRLTEPLDPMVGGGSGLPAFARGLQQFDKAHVVMLTEQGIILRSGARACLEALREMDEAGDVKVRSELPDILHGGEVFLIRKLGMDVGGLIHAGRSSWDLGRVSHRIGLRGALLDVMAAIVEYRRALLEKAAEHVETVMPYYTHGQQGQPTTFAHHVHGFVCAAERDFERLEGAYSRVNISPAGAAAGTATRFDTDRTRVAELMGFDEVSSNTRDSSYNYDYLWEMAAALGCVAASLGFLADEIILWMGNEFGLVQLADRYCGTSSIMTHKRNPTAAEQVQGTRSRITGRVPTSYTPADLMETAGQVVKSLQLCAGMVKTLKVNREAMLATAANSWAQASDLAAVLVQEKGLSMRTAHQIVGVMVRLAEEQGVRPIDAGPELLDSAAQLFLGSSLELDKTEMADAMDPVVAVATRRAIGSPGSPEMRRQIDASRRLLVGDEDRLSQMRQRSKTAAEKLETAIDALLA